MAKITGYNRTSHQTLITGGQTFSVPPSEDFTDGTWNIDGSELMLSEIGINEIDNKAYVRIGNNINQFSFIGGVNGNNLSQTLAIGNDSGANNIIMGTGTNIHTSQGTGGLSFDITGPQSVYLGDDMAATANYLWLRDGSFLRLRATNNPMELGAQSSTIGIGDDYDGIVLAPYTGLSTHIYYGGSEILSVTGSGIVMQSATVIKSDNTGGRIALDASSVAGEVYITTDDGSEATSYLKLSGSGQTAELAGIPGYSYISIGGNSQWFNMDSVTFNSNKVEVNSEIFNVSMGDDASGNGGDTIKVGNNVLNSIASDTGSKLATIIGSDNSRIGTASYNTVIIGGQNIVADTSNSVYVPDLYIQTNKSIKSTSGGGQIDLDFMSSFLALSTDNGTFAESYLLLGTNSFMLQAPTGYLVQNTAGDLYLSTSGLSNIVGNRGVSIASSYGTVSIASSTGNIKLVTGPVNSVDISSGYVNVNSRTFKFATTANAAASTTTLASISMINNQTLTIQVVLNAYCASPNRNLGITMMASFLKYGGTIYQTGTTNSIVKDGFGDGSTATIDTDGTNVRIRITNGSGLTTNWAASYDYLLT